MTALDLGRWSRLSVCVVPWPQMAAQGRKKERERVWEIERERESKVSQREQARQPGVSISAWPAFLFLRWSDVEKEGLFVPLNGGSILPLILSAPAQAVTAVCSQLTLASSLAFLQYFIGNNRLIFWSHLTWFLHPPTLGI